MSINAIFLTPLRMNSIAVAEDLLSVSLAIPFVFRAEFPDSIRYRYIAANCN